MKIINLSKGDEDHSHEIKEINLLGGSWIDPATIREVFDNLRHIIIIDVVMCDRISHLCVYNLAVDVIPAVVEVLEPFR